MRLDGYFIAPDAHDDVWLWRKHGETPVPVLARRDLRDAPQVWFLIVAATKEKP